VKSPWNLASEMTNRKKRILHITSGLGLGGAEMMLYRLVQSLHGQGQYEHAVVALTSGCDFDFDLLGVSVDLVDFKKTWNIMSGLAALRRTIKKYDPDVIHAWMYHGNLAATLASSIKVPVVWGIHHSLHDLKHEKLSIRFLIRAGAFLSRKRNIRRIVYVSEQSRAHHSAYGYSLEKSVVIPNGFDCVAFAPDQVSRVLVRGELGFGESHVLIGNFGRYHRVKAHDLLVRAFASVANDFADSRLVLAGAGVVGENGELTTLVRSLGIEGRVVLLGPRGDMSRLYNAIDLYVLSSNSESFPNVLGEASACGVPSITTDVGDASRIVGNTGCVVPPFSVEALARALRRMLSMEPRERRFLGARARQHVIEHFEISAVSQKYAELYNGMSDR
jgi:glycosyltransferase involved in cell wall biosynthesis